MYLAALTSYPGMLDVKYFDPTGKGRKTDGTNQFYGARRDRERGGGAVYLQDWGELNNNMHIIKPGASLTFCGAEDIEKSNPSSSAQMT